MSLLVCPQKQPSVGAALPRSVHVGWDIYAGREGISVGFAIDQNKCLHLELDAKHNVFLCEFTASRSRSRERCVLQTLFHLRGARITLSGRPRPGHPLVFKLEKSLLFLLDGSASRFPEPGVPRWQEIRFPRSPLEHRPRHLQLHRKRHRSIQTVHFDLNRQF